jgi:hypothetical protein
VRGYEGTANLHTNNDDNEAMNLPSFHFTVMSVNTMAKMPTIKMK